MVEIGRTAPQPGQSFARALLFFFPAAGFFTNTDEGKDKEKTEKKIIKTVKREFSLRKR